MKASLDINFPSSLTKKDNKVDKREIPQSKPDSVRFSEDKNLSLNAVQETLDMGKTNVHPNIIKDSSQGEKTVNCSHDMDIPSVNVCSTSTENLSNLLIW